MGSILAAAALAVALLFGLGVARAAELFAARIRAGRVEFFRGRAPLALMGDFRDVLRGAGDANLRVVLDRGRPALRVRGDLTAEQAQRLRNVLGRFTTAQLRTAPRCRPRRHG